MIRIVISLIIKDFKIIMRHRKALIASVCLPFLLYAFFSLAFSDMMKREADISPLKIAVVDKENSKISKMLIKSFMDNKAFSNMIKTEVCSYEEAKLKFEAGKLTAIIQIPDGFSTSLKNLDNYPLEITLNSKEPLKASILKNMFNSYSGYVSSVQRSVVSLMNYLEENNLSDQQLQNINEAVSLELISTALSRNNIFEEKAVDFIPSASSKEYFIITIIVLLVMYNGVVAGAHIIKEGRDGCIKRISTSPFGELIYIFSKAISFTIYCTFQAIIIILPLSIFSGLDKLFFIKDMLIYINFSIFLIINIFLFIALFFYNEETFILSGNIFVFICAIIGGCFLPLQLMPIEIQKISSITPNYWIIKGAMYLVNYYPLEKVKEYLLSFFSIALILLCLSTLKVRKLVKH